MLGTPEYRVPGLTFGAPYNYPQTLNQNNWTGRADLSLHKDKHDIKIGGEYIHVHNGGPWFIQRAGLLHVQQRAGQPRRGAAARTRRWTRRRGTCSR